MLDLTKCLDNIDKDNIELESRDGEMHVSAALWLWDNQYEEIMDRCGISKDLGLTSHAVIVDTDIIVNVYADISKTAVAITAFVDTGETCTDYTVILTEQETEQLKQCFDNALMCQAGISLTDALTSNNRQKG